MNKKIILTVICAGIAAAFATAQTNDSVASSGNPVVARGTGFAVTRGDLENALGPQLQTLSSTQQLKLQRMTLTNLINTKLLLAKATDADRSQAQKTVDLQMTAAIENAGSKEIFDERLKTNGLSEASLRARLTEQATAQAVLQRELKVNVSDEEVKKYYETHTAEFEQPEMARISHILVFTVDPMTQAALPPGQLDARRREAELIVRAARSGADFDVLAKQYSEDAGSKADGGELPPFPRGEMAHEIESAAFSMTNNQVSDVITTSVGYQIIKLQEKIPAKKVDYLTAAAKIKQFMTRQKFEQLAGPYLEGLRRAASVEIVDTNLKSPAAP